MASQQDVAKLAKVSFMTVSRVINGAPNVRDETRRRVLKAIEELSYSPNEAARALNSRKSHSIGIIFPRKEYLLIAPFCVELCVELESRLQQRGYHLFLGSLAKDYGSRDLADLYGEGKVDGLILFAPEIGDAGVERLAARGLPLVVAFGRAEAAAFPSVDSDNAKGVSLLMAHLFGLGHRRIGMVAGPMRERDARDRLTSYHAALEGHGLPIEPELVFQGDWSLESGYAGFASLLSSPNPPSAIFFSNDQMAIGGIKAAHDLGVRIPGDVSITGYDDIQYAAFITPALTTVRQNIGAVGAQVADLVLDCADGMVEPRHIILEPELIVRESTSPIL